MYQMTQGKDVSNVDPNNPCGGADKWADVQTTQNIFCPVGMYCPDTITKKDCTPGWVPIYFSSIPTTT